MQNTKNIVKICFVLTVILYSISYCSDADNIKNKKQKLGKYLFFDTRLSLNNTKSCASCHNPAFAFTDGYRTSITALGDNVLHNSPSIINAVYLKKFDWANPSISNLYTQVKRPLFGTHPIELGLDKHIYEFKKILANNNLYKKLFEEAYSHEDSLYTTSQIENSIVAYVQSITSFNSNFDDNLLTESQQKGFALFTNNTLNCSKCHPPPFFTLATQTNNLDSIYMNTGLYNVRNKDVYPNYDNGLANFTKKLTDDGKFKIPSLRNVLITSPYLHDGSAASIEEVIDTYARGGRNITVGNNIGDGKLNKNKHSLINGFKISKKEKQELIDFLSSLTDSSLFNNPHFKSPF